MDDAILVIGIGNSSRGDDGLGWALLDQLADVAPASGRRCRYDLQLEYRYQLAVEDAELLTHFSKVIFVDACESPLPGGFSLEACLPDTAPGLYTHQQTPGAILYLSQELYQHRPEAYRLLVQGYEWAFDTGLTAAAQANLKEAVAELLLFLVHPHSFQRMDISSGD